MITAPFTYRRAGSLAEALALLTEHGEDAKLLAGGHSLLPLMKLRLAAPEMLVDISGLRELSYVQDEGDTIAIGALTRHRELEASPLLAREAPLLAHAAGRVGDPQVRHRGTIGGSLVHGDAAADLPAVALAMDATLVVTGPAGTREIAAGEFFTDLFQTALGPDELLTEVRIPKPAASGWSFQKFTRRAIDWAIVGVAVSDGTRPGIGLINMGPVPLRATAVEQALAGGASIADAAALAAEGTQPPDEPGAGAAYRTHLVRVLVRRALELAAQRGGAA
ncbi:FAD binding domain-containing protein [Pseudonocardia kunmingensis]|uniref:Carbon-monoxide dehydrogenase medium subunit n=1 Tax=Pseudonocardia kunmingensis TaxID=630975 RepID=A0A543DQQ4_9PSEU|nr:xanthine dehydrogenase family protein subunit M [Pseudonocardia kunmingensis]TQM11660.1 carbon-monoxide dehydrogenase medium subunit [Pseudonocardia kunmingensis]